MQFMVKIKHVYQRNNKYYYQRSVPEDLQVSYGKKIIKLPISSVNLKEVERMALALSKKHTNEFIKLRLKAPSERAKQARAYLESDNWKIQQVMTQPLSMPKEDIIDLALMDLIDSGDEAAALAVKMRPSGHIPFASEALEVWKEWKAKELTDKNSADTERSIIYLIQVAGDKAVSEYSPKEAYDFMMHIIDEKGNATSTAKKNISNVRSVFKRCFARYGINQLTPFDNLELPKLQDTQKRGAFNEEEIKIIRSHIEGNKNIRALIIALQMGTGATVGEIVGLGEDDVHLDTNIPFIDIRPRNWRSLKNNTARPRKVPLVSFAHDAAMQALRQAENGYLFPTYLKTGKANINSASQAVNKNLKSLLPGTNKTSHCFRHTVITLLLNEGCPVEIRNSIVGHSAGTVAEMSYEHGELPLAKKAEWLSTIFFAHIP